MLRYRLLGRTGLRVSEIGLGTMSFGNQWGFGADEATSHRILDAYAEAGGNFLDTANMYHRGETEQMLGSWLGAHRDRMVVATKYSLSMDPHDANASGNHRKSLVRSVEGSLQRLGTDHIDLLWAHAYDDQTPIDETLRALDDLVRSGKVLYIGISDAPAWIVSASQVMAELRGWTAWAGLQIEYSLLERTPERDLLPMAEHFGMSVVAWGPLSAGVLTGKYTRGGEPDTLRKGANQHRGRLSPEALDVARAVDAVADEIGASSTQVALAWVMGRGYGLVPIVGARTVDQLADTLGAGAVHLSEAQRARLDEASGIELGFPHDFLRTEHVQKVLHGEHVLPRLRKRPTSGR